MSGISEVTATTTGVFSGFITANSSANGNVQIEDNDNNFVGSIDNVSVKEVGQFSLDETTNNNNAKLLTGNCLDFDGTNDYLNIDGFTMSGTNATFAFWINPDAIASYNSVFDANPQRLILTFSGGVFKIFESGAHKSFGVVPQDVWSRVVVTISGTTAKCFLNGVQLGSNVTISNIDFSSATQMRSTGWAQTATGAIPLTAWSRLPPVPLSRMPKPMNLSANC